MKSTMSQLTTLEPEQQDLITKSINLIDLALIMIDTHPKVVVKSLEEARKMLKELKRI